MYIMYNSNTRYYYSLQQVINSINNLIIQVMKQLFNIFKLFPSMNQGNVSINDTQSTNTQIIISSTNGLLGL